MPVIPAPAPNPWLLTLSQITADAQERRRIEEAQAKESGGFFSASGAAGGAALGAAIALAPFTGGASLAAGGLAGVGGAGLASAAAGGTAGALSAAATGALIGGGVGAIAGKKLSPRMKPGKPSPGIAAQPGNISEDNARIMQGLTSLAQTFVQAPGILENQAATRAALKAYEDFVLQEGPENVYNASQAYISSLPPQQQAQAKGIATAVRSSLTDAPAGTPPLSPGLQAFLSQGQKVGAVGPASRPLPGSSRATGALAVHPAMPVAAQPPKAPPTLQPASAAQRPKFDYVETDEHQRLRAAAANAMRSPLWRNDPRELSRFIGRLNQKYRRTPKVKIPRAETYDEYTASGAESGVNPETGYFAYRTYDAHGRPVWEHRKAEPIRQQRAPQTPGEMEALFNTITHKAPDGSRYQLRYDSEGRPYFDGLKDQETFDDVFKRDYAEFVKNFQYINFRAPTVEELKNGLMEQRLRKAAAKEFYEGFVTGEMPAKTPSAQPAQAPQTGQPQQPASAPIPVTPVQKFLDQHFRRREQMSAEEREASRERATAFARAILDEARQRPMTQSQRDELRRLREIIGG